MHCAAWRETYRGQISDDYLAWLNPELCAKIFSHRAPANVFVAEEEGRIVGFAVVGHAQEEDAPPRTGELCGLYVLKEYQRQSVGKALFARAAERLRSIGYRHLILWVLDTNRNAQGFYEKMGMKPDGKFKVTQLGTTVTELRMTGELSDFTTQE